MHFCVTHVVVPYTPHHSVPRLGSACPHSGQRGLTGRLRSKATSKAEQKQVDIYLMCEDQTVGGGLPPMAVGQSQMCLLTLPHREQAPSHICTEYRQPESVGSKAASLCF